MKSTFSLSFVHHGIAAGILVLMTAGLSRGGPLPPYIPDPNYPVIGSILGSITYTASTGVFQADSLPLTYTSFYTINDSSWAGAAFFDLSYGGIQDVSVNLALDSSGNFVSNGSGFSLSGAIDLDNDGTDDVTGALLTGSINDFGFDTSLSASAGLFDITGGLLTQNINLSGGGTLFGGFTVGTLGIFVLEDIQATSGTFGDFTKDMAASFGKDTEGEALAIAEPASFTLALVGLAALGMTRRWSRRILRQKTGFSQNRVSK